MELHDGSRFSHEEVEELQGALEKLASTSSPDEKTIKTLRQFGERVAEANEREILRKKKAADDERKRKRKRIGELQAEVRELERGVNE